MCTAFMWMHGTHANKRRIPVMKAVIMDSSWRDHIDKYGSLFTMFYNKHKSRYLSLKLGQMPLGGTTGCSVVLLDPHYSHLSHNLQKYCHSNLYILWFWWFVLFTSVLCGSLWGFFQVFPHSDRGSKDSCGTWVMCADVLLAAEYRWKKH